MVEDDEGRSEGPEQPEQPEQPEASTVSESSESSSASAGSEGSEGLKTSSTEGPAAASTPVAIAVAVAAPDAEPAAAQALQVSAEVLEASAEPEDSKKSVAARVIDRITYLFVHRGSALLYQLTMAVTIGALLGTVIALVLFGEKNFEILIGGVGGIAVVSGLLRWVVASVPELDDRGRVLSAKRRVFMLTVIATGFVFFGHYWSIRSGFPVIPLGQDTELYRRINDLEEQVKQVEAELGTVPMHRHNHRSAPRVRSWRRIPVRPGRPYNLRIETGDTSRDVWVELIVTDEQGNLLGARRAISSRDLRLTVVTDDHWSINAGVRWWPRDGGGPLDLAPAGEAPRAPIELQLTATEAQEGRTTTSWSGAVAERTFDGLTLTASGSSSDSSSDRLRGRCGGDGANELLYRIDLSGQDEGGWLALSAQSELSMATILGLYAEEGRSTDDDGAETFKLRELACDGSGFMFDRGAEELRRDALTSTLQVAIPPGVYYVAVDGLPKPRQQRTPSSLPFTLRGVFTPFDAAGTIRIDGGLAASTHLVDLVSARSVQTCDQRDIAYIDLPIRLDARGTIVTASVGSVGSMSASSYATRLAWLPEGGAEPGCDLYDVAPGARSTVNFDEGSSRTIRLFRPAPIRQAAVESLSFRVDTPASDALKAACAAAPPLVRSLGGSYFGQTGSGSSPIVGRDKETMSDEAYAQSQAFAVTACAADARWEASAPVGGEGAQGPRNPFDYAPGEDTSESIWRLDLTQASTVDLMVASSTTGTRMYTSIISQCDTIPQVLACEQTLGPDKVTMRRQLPAGTYYIIADGEGTHFLALDATPVSDDPLDPRSDPRVE